MSEDRVEILRVATEVGRHIQTVAEDAGQNIRREVVLKYAEPSCYYLWKCMRARYSHKVTEPWTTLLEFFADATVQSSETILLFDEIRETTMFSFRSGHDLIATLQECYRMEFYVTGLPVEYLWCWNHHDFLIGCGAAAEWLRVRA